MTAHILLVEDEAGLRLGISDLLRSEGYEVDMARDGLEGEGMAQGGGHALIVLDVMLPEKSGMDICRDLRRAGVEVPILMLTARGELIDKVLGLRLGADDYLTKPFENLELLARIEALLRRAGPGPGMEVESYTFGDVRVDFRRAEVSRQEKTIELSALEFKLLHYFVHHRGELLSRERLLDEVWGYAATPATRTVDQHVSSLRRKLEVNPAHPRFIVTQHRLGYKFLG
ncbi:MAG: response regulator transcription factor [Thermoanaerobaculia bacterium]|nr:response regulator transcription factor [Thermoanaerobaculia bacterium]